MSLLKWDQATCSGCQVQLSDDAFDIQSRLKRATPTEVVVQWKCPNCNIRSETVFEYKGDVDPEQ